MDEAFDQALKRFQNGDFSLLAALLATDGRPSMRSRIAEWYERRLFADHLAEAAEALTCASFLGERATVEYLIDQGLDPSGGSLSGMNAVHVAATRGNVDALRVLLHHGVPLEVRNMYGGTALAQTVWSAVNQPMPGQRDAIKELIRAGADVKEVDFPTGNAGIDLLLWGRTSN